MSGESDADNRETDMKEDEGDSGAERRTGSLSETLHGWRYLFAFLGLAGLVGLYYAEENWRGYRAWETYKQRMTARGEPFEPANFIPPPVSDEENFAMTPALAPLFEFIPGTQKWRDPDAPQLFQALWARYNTAAGYVKSTPAERVNSWVRGHTDLSAWAAAFSQPTNSHARNSAPLIVTNFAARDAATRVLEGLSEFSPVLDELRTASRRPKVRFNLRYEEENPASIVLPHLSKIKYFCQVLALRTSAELALGHSDEAMNDLDLLLYLINASRDEPVLISQLVRMSELQIALQPIAEGMGQWSEPQLRALQERLQTFDFCADTRRSWQAERVLFGGGIIECLRRAPNKLRMMEELERVGDSGEFVSMLPIGVLMAAAPNGWLYLDQLGYSRNFDKYLLPIIDVTNRQIHPAAVRTAEAAISKLAQGSPAARYIHHEFFSGLLLSSLPGVAEKTAFAQTAVDTAALACALERYHLAHGRFPDSLERLTPAFMAKLPHDVINGKPLTYRLDPDGHYRLYSIGWNEKDDGGLIKQTKNGEVEKTEGDWVWAGNF